MADSPPTVIAVIPARYASTRLPGKMLAEVDGVPLIVRTLQNAHRCATVDEVIVATDDQRIADAVSAAGGAAVMTNPELPSGSDRIHAALADRDAGIVVNIQGDEPALPPQVVDDTVRLLLDTPAADATTAATPATSAELADPNVVKVVTAADGRALYFSRAAIPHAREGAVPAGMARRHLGLYVYRRETLTLFCSLPPSPLEELEKLEQLRLLDAGLTLWVEDVMDAGPGGVDTAEDLERVRAWFAERP